MNDTQNDRWCLYLVIQHNLMIFCIWMKIVAIYDWETHDQTDCFFLKNGISDKKGLFREKRTD